MSLSSKLQLRENEEIIEIIRSTSAHYFFRYLITVAMVSLNAFFTFWLWGKGIEGQIFNSVVWFVSIYLIVGTWISGRSNHLIITNFRIFDIHRESWLKETISSLNFHEIEDVVITRHGVLSAMFNFGIVTIHPKQAKFAIEILHIPQPQRVQNMLFEKRDFSLKNIDIADKEIICQKFSKIIPNLGEAELTLYYQKIHRQLLKLAEPPVEKEENVI